MNSDLEEFIEVVWQNLDKLSRDYDVYEIYTCHDFVRPETQFDITGADLWAFLEPLLEITTKLEKSNADSDRDFVVTGFLQYDLYKDTNTNRVLKHIVDQGRGYPTELAETFFYFRREEYLEKSSKAGKDGQGSGAKHEKCRLYLAFDDGDYPAAATKSIEILLDAMGSTDAALAAFTDFKVMGPLRRGRRDNVVAYFSNKKARALVTERVRAEQKKEGGMKLTAGPLPFCVEKKADGIGWADDPPGGESFGGRLAEAIWAAAKAFRGPQRGPEEKKAFKEAIGSEFVDRAINPERPSFEVGYFKPPPSAGAPKTPSTPPFTRAATAAATSAATRAAGVPGRRSSADPRPRADAVGEREHLGAGLPDRRSSAGTHPRANAVGERERGSQETATTTATG